MSKGKNKKCMECSSIFDMVLLLHKQMLLFAVNLTGSYGVILIKTECIAIWDVRV